MTRSTLLPTEIVNNSMYKHVHLTSLLTLIENTTL